MKKKTEKLTIGLNEKTKSGITLLKDRFNIFDDEQLVIFAIQELAFREEAGLLEHRMRIRQLMEAAEKDRKELEQNKKDRNVI